MRALEHVLHRSSAGHRIFWRTSVLEKQTIVLWSPHLWRKFSSPLTKEGHVNPLHTGCHLISLCISEPLEHIQSHLSLGLLLAESPRWGHIFLEITVQTLEAMGVARLLPSLHILDLKVCNRVILSQAVIIFQDVPVLRDVRLQGL
ncbi:hypothetical protein Ac2012v2_008223 [Leucoagaricus gongylophorus]